MSFLDKYNTTTFTYDFSTFGFRDQGLKGLYETFGKDAKFRIHGLFETKKGKYEPHPVAVLDHELVNLPRHRLDNVQALLKDSRAIKAINENIVAIQIYKYTLMDGDHYSTKFVEICPDDNVPDLEAKPIPEPKQEPMQQPEVMGTQEQEAKPIPEPEQEPMQQPEVMGTQEQEVNTCNVN